jgi:hypothetical protein
MCRQPQFPTVSGMTTIRIRLRTHVPADRVLFAAYDMGPRRVEVFPAVRSEHFTVHSSHAQRADVTEGTPAGIGINWERCDYDWSQPGRVVATVTESNVYAIPGSVWELTAAPAEQGSAVEMTWTRRFRRTGRGMFFGTMFRIVGPLIFRGYARTTLRNIERLAAERASSARSA